MVEGKAIYNVYKEKQWNEELYYKVDGQTRMVTVLGTRNVVANRGCSYRWYIYAPDTWLVEGGGLERLKHSPFCW